MNEPRKQCELRGDRRQGGMEAFWRTLDPSADLVAAAVRRLNGHEYTWLLLVDDAADADAKCHLSVVGGGEGRYLVRLTFDTEVYWCAVRPEAGRDLVPLAAFGMETEVAADLVVDRETASAAALGFLRTRKRAPGLTWESR